MQCKKCPFNTPDRSEWMKHLQFHRKEAREQVVTASLVPNLPPEDAVTASFVAESQPAFHTKEVKHVANKFTQLQKAFNEMTDADSRAAITRLMQEPNLETMAEEEFRAVAMRLVSDGDARAAIWRNVEWN